MSKKILITAFEPFGGESINPALEAVKRLPNEIDSFTIAKAQLPVVYRKSIDVLYEALKTEKPFAVICVGQAGGQPDIRIERVAINIDDTMSPDNDGVILVDTPIFEDAPAAYFATLPIKTTIDNLKESGIPASISNSAGTYVCNHVMYAALHYAAQHQPEMKAGFVHIPYLPSQAVGKCNTPSVSAEIVVDALKVIIRTIADGM